MAFQIRSFFQRQSPHERDSPLQTPGQVHNCTFNLTSRGRSFLILTGSGSRDKSWHVHPVCEDHTEKKTVALASKFSVAHHQPGFHFSHHPFPFSFLRRRNVDPLTFSRSVCHLPHEALFLRVPYISSLDVSSLASFSWVLLVFVFTHIGFNS